MSSTESSGAPAEATATTPASDAAFPTFGSTRGSGLARGKRPSSGPSASVASTPSDYKPTAIEVINAPREYTNPFAPATPEPAAPAAEVSAPAPVVVSAPIITPAPVAPAAPVEETPAELNILPPAEQKATAAQTWESEGFRPGRESRPERPRREERAEAPADEPVDIASIPAKFLYVRPGVTFVPTPRNWGGAPRERRLGDESAPRSPETSGATEASAPAPAPSGGFFGWLKSLFGGAPASPAAKAEAEAATGEARRDGGQRRHRGGRSRGGPGGEGGRGRSRGGRGRSGGGGSGGYRDERGSSQGGI